MSRPLLLALALGVAALPAAFAPAAHAEQSCHITGKMMSRTAMEQSLHARGFTTIRNLSTHNGCYEAKGIDKNGKRFELELAGDTGAIHNRE
ncbi:MAG: PepSY domain-containing protein [Rhodospirillales bacterium]|nr:PepSY domain-containing protein [Rhodospirillales bacterium]MDE2197953.1 PepSY domain-containing protein [Rhodospirillales bacterium]MDE2576494.1 PepSY domain-containing protein [Rhodospirillales bacterium]